MTGARMVVAKPARKTVKPAAAAAHRVRIIGGQWKRTLLPVLDAQGLRPTPDRVRETVFNWLNHLLGANWTGVRCLDLFAGSGALGFEAASRGAAEVVMVEDHTPAVRQLEAVAAKLQAQQVQIRRADALAAVRSLAQAGRQFRVIFLDPPYHQGWLEKMLPECERVLEPGGLIYAESEFTLEQDKQALPAWMSGWEALRSDRAGAVFYHLLQRNSAPRIAA